MKYYIHKRTRKRAYRQSRQQGEDILNDIIMCGPS